MKSWPTNPEINGKTPVSSNRAHSPRTGISVRIQRLRDNIVEDRLCDEAKRVAKGFEKNYKTFLKYVIFERETMDGSK